MRQMKRRRKAKVDEAVTTNKNAIDQQQRRCRHCETNGVDLINNATNGC